MFVGEIVSIPSSSGHVGRPSGFAQKANVEPQYGFNPLFIGACWATAGHTKDIASSSAGFNPLFIGACWATWIRFSGHSRWSVLGFNPLFIGACWATLKAQGRTPVFPEFQSPLHRGMLGDYSTLQEV